MEDSIFDRFSEGIKKFNEGSFYECHDILEDVWFDIRGPSRRFYQGLIHLAVGFYHILVRENPKGAVSQLTKGIEKLKNFEPSFQGVELTNLIGKIKICLEEVKKGGTDDFNPKIIPKIKFNPSLFKEP
jgi:predicted metal-dependent hydrolase